jgi:uncharacterized protein (UPF0332 family)
MISEGRDYLDRAGKSLRSARLLNDSGDYDGATSRAYYAAFYAITALFAGRGATFTKHSAIESAVNRDLVKTGEWRPELGADYSALRDIRRTADYGGPQHVSSVAAHEAISAAERIIKEVEKSV